MAGFERVKLYTNVRSTIGQAGRSWIYFRRPLALSEPMQHPDHMPNPRTATATWSGTGKEGTGHISTPSGVLNNTPHSFLTRFVSEDGKAGTNPEELIAAAHASCFTMKLSFVLGNHGFTPEELQCTSTVTMGPVPGGTGIVGIHLDLKARVPGVSQDLFNTCTEDAKVNCPISQVLKSVPITLSATLG